MMSPSCKHEQNNYIYCAQLVFGLKIKTKFIYTAKSEKGLHYDVDFSV